MKKIQSKIIPRYSKAFLLICGAGIMAFILIGLYPSQKSLANLDLEIRKLQDQREEQLLLYPFYQKLLEKLQVEKSEMLPSPNKSSLPRDKTDKISFIFCTIAQKSNLKNVSVIPDVRSLASGFGHLLINASAEGGFSNFRKFLIELGGTPYVEHIEEIQIQQGPGVKEFRLKIWIALD